ncbi:25421_t:CDS:2, partial [Racocetra persica]
MSECLILFKQCNEIYLNSFSIFSDDMVSSDDLRILANPFFESLLKNNRNAWKNKAETFLKRAEILYKEDLATNFPVDNKRIFNNTEIEQYFQEEMLRFSYKVSNIFPYAMVNDICAKYKETALLIITEFQMKNNKNIEEIPQKIKQYILEWDIILDANTRSVLERWQYEVAELLLISITIPELAALPSFQLLRICSNLINGKNNPSSFRRVIRSIVGRDMGKILSEQFVIDILVGLESNELKSVQMSFINSCLGIIPLTSSIRQLFYKPLFVHNPFIFASPIMRSIFLAENEKYQNAFFDLLKDPQIVFESLPDLKIINDLLKENDPDSRIAALSCDIIQKTFFVNYDLTELHHNFSRAVDSLSANNIEPLQNISAIAFLKEYVRAFCDSNKTTLKEYVRTSRSTNEANLNAKIHIDTYMNKIIRDINNQLKSKWPRIHSLKIYFLKYLRSCNFSMKDIRDLCESQEQPFPWLNEIPWEDQENWLSFNPYWLHQDYRYAEDYYYHVYDDSKRDEANVNRFFALYLKIARSKMPNMKKNDLVIFAGVIVARLHYIRASREWTDNEIRIVDYLTKEIETMNVSSIYKEMFLKLKLNSNSLIQLLKDNEVDLEDNKVDELLMKSVIVHLIIVHASIPDNESPLAAYLHQLQVCQDDFILTCPSDVEGVVMNAVASFRDEDGAGSGVARYQCICGEKFIVLDCGGFSNPEERDPNKYSISGECLNCNRVIGYGSNEGEYTRLDTDVITSFPIKHEPGYIVEQISTEKTHNARMMTPQAYRILHLFVHTLGASVPSSIASKFFEKNGNNAGDPMVHCLNNICNDWKILRDIFDYNDEQLALILHSIISSMIEGPQSNEWRLDTPEKREEWEDKF